jgi:hypothetical protein
VAGLCAAFVLADPHGIPAGLCSGRESFISTIPQYLTFVMLEFGVFAALAWACKSTIPSIVLSSIVLMCILPFIQLGAANDLQMRGSEIPMCIVGFFVIQALQSRRSIIALSALTVSVILGVISGSQEALKSVKDRIGEFTWSTPTYAVNWDGNGANYTVVPQYVAEIKNNSLFGRMLKQLPNTMVISPPIQITDISNWSEYGNAEFTPSQNKITSKHPTDAGFYSELIDIPKGIYKIEAWMDWDATTEFANGLGNNVHLSILGERKLINIQNSEGKNRKISFYSTFTGEPLRIAFGLGGWAKGEGFVQLKSMKIVKISMPD